MVTPASSLKARSITTVSDMEKNHTATSLLCSQILQRTCHALTLFLVLAVGLSSCSPRYHDMPSYWPVPTREYDNYGPGRFKTAYLASQIDRHFRGSAPGPIGVTTFVNIDDLYSTSTFGRMYAEQLMSELSMHGFDVVELRHSDALQFLDSSGEFALSRDVRSIKPERNLAAIVVGTYVASPERVYVNARLVNPSTSLVLSAGSVEMSRTGELTKLLRGGSIPGSLERIPVRHLNTHPVQMNPFDVSRQRQWASEEASSDPYAINPQPSSNSQSPSVPQFAKDAPNGELPSPTGALSKNGPQIEVGGRALPDKLTNEK